VHDWRHNFIKIMAVVNIILALINFVANTNVGIFVIIIFILQLINLYAFFTYIGDLNDTKCPCAVEKQHKLNIVMRIYRWLWLLIMVVGGIGVLLLGSNGLQALANKK
jgi:hypothetical protein